MRTSLIASAALIALAGIAKAEIINVPDDFATIQAGIDAAQDGDTVLVQPGEYVGKIKFTGSNIVLASLRLTSGDDAYIDSTIILGEASGDSIVAIQNGEDSTTVFDGFTISGGGDLDRYGVRIYHAGPVLRHLHVFNCMGAGMHLIASSFLLDKCIIENTRGIGVLCDKRSSGNVINCDFRDNHTFGIEIDNGSSVSLFGVDIHANTGTGAVVRDASIAKMTKVRIYENGNENMIGGGLMISHHADVEVRDFTINGNRADNGGGVYLMEGGKLKAEDGVISGNSATTDGGGALLDVAKLSLSRVLLLNNVANRFGGAIRAKVPYEAIDSIFCDHVVLSGHASARSISITFTAFRLINSIIRGNESPFMGGELSQADISYSDIEGGRDEIDLNEGLDWGDGNIDSDPLFADPDNGDYHLTAESPCIDTGDPESDLDPDGTRADIGAFYFHQRDIDVQPPEVHFPVIPWGETDSTLALIQNVGGTNLHISNVAASLNQGCIWGSLEGEYDPPLEILPDSSLDFWLYFRPDSQAEPNRSFLISSDDPDEPEFNISADGQFPDGVRGNDIAPIKFGITAIHPNPFNQLTIVNYQLPLAGRASLAIYDIAGRQISNQESVISNPGRHQAVIDGTGLPSGVYYLSLQTQKGQRDAAKMVVVR